MKDLKTCTKCFVDKTLDEFYKRKGTSDGYRNDCKECVKHRTASRYMQNRDDILHSRKKYREDHREEINEYLRDYWSVNREELLEKKRQYRLENLQRIREKDRLWAKRNPEKIRANQEVRRARKRDAFIEHVSYEVLRERDGDDCCICHSPIDFTLKDRDPMMVSLEHVVPLSRGGEHSYANTALSHLRCNLSKGAKTLDEVHESTYSKEAV